ncbi:hypothetical protein TDSAC_0390 [Thermodesulfobium acidiphilum]|uniref:Glucosyl transferase GtrII n=1 Tax=Thermodesulfobium acidiphilum TaxID=1794699 RepID=A0A2R4VZ92_THEAF|nr:hypothetical protein [Thermodesulfobium acidiphilum]AWB09766.1 hypothetical protein TDSAC_0390 [Thermodesulfobium acidiphilum]
MKVSLNNNGNSKQIGSIEVKNFFKIIYIYIFTAVPIIFYLWIILRFTVNMPWWDDYDAVLNWINRFISHQNNFNYLISMLFEQHNEHRILFDRIFILFNYYVFGSINFIFLNYIGYLGLFAIFGLMLWLSVKNGVSGIYLLPIPFLTFSLCQYELISFAMASMQQYWQLFFCLIAIILITKNEDIKTSYLVLSLLFSIIASFTGAGGLIVFPTTLIYLIIYKRGIKNIIIWLSISILTFIFYFVILQYHQTAIGIASHQFVVEHPLKYIAYIFCFIGNIAGDKITSFILGLLLFLSILFLGSKFYKKNTALILISFFIIATAAAAGLSRVSMGVVEATSSRYTIYSSILLACLYILLIGRIKSILYKRNIFIISSLIAISIFLCWVPKGIASLENKEVLLKSSLVYPSEQRAIKILENSFKLGTFMPIAQIYKFLPSYYAFAIDLNQPTSYTIESITLNNTKPLYNLSQNPTPPTDINLTKNDKNDIIQISGWAVDSVAKNADRGVIAVIDNKYFYPLGSGVQRPDVSKAFNNSNYEYSGFSGSIPLNELSYGKHILTLRIINYDETGYYESKPIELNIEK